MDKEESGMSRKREFSKLGIRVVMGISLAFALFQLYTALFGNLDSLRQRSIHLLFAASLVFIMFPARSKSHKHRISVWDGVLILFTLLPIGYILIEHKAVLNRMYYVSPLEWYQYVFAGMLIIAVIEGTRRAMGLALPVVALISLAYAFFGKYIPGSFGHSGFTLVELIDQIYLTTEGIFGIPLGVSATYVVLFIIFGAFLQRSGVGDYFMELASALTMKSRGGPAKMAVLSSGLFGSISGSALANVATTGQITIPMMKKTGYKAEFAGAVEAVASTGGQIMPPVMGAAVFVMSEFTGIPYITILKHALLPAILYFLSVYFMVHFEAVKTGIQTPDLSKMPDRWTLIKGSYKLIPLFLIVGALMSGFSPTYAVMVSLASVVIVSLFDRVNRMGFKSIIYALITGVQGAIGVAMATAAAGIIVGIATYTGLGFKFTSVMMEISQGDLTVALLMTALATIILGIGLPTTPAYIVVAALMVPALVKLDISLISAHLFAFYFANIANITPPVALAAYTAAGIANSDAIKTGVQAFKLGIAAYIVPFMFVFNPSLLLIGNDILKLILAIATSLVGVYMLAAASESFLVRPMNVFERLIALTASIALIYPGFWTDSIGIIAVALVLFIQLILKKRKEVS